MDRQIDRDRWIEADRQRQMGSQTEKDRQAQIDSKCLKTDRKRRRQIDRAEYTEADTIKNADRGNTMQICVSI